MPRLMRARFLGEPNLIEVYRGDGFYCNTKEPATCDILVSEEKASQLYRDFPDYWEFPGTDSDTLARQANGRMGINAVFVGSEAKTRYRGDGLSCDLDQPDTCNVVVSDDKAFQLMRDFPGEWEFPDLRKRKFLREYEKTLRTRIEATKGIKVTDIATGKEEIYPPGTEIAIKTPSQSEPKILEIGEPTPKPAPPASEVDEEPLEVTVTEKRDLPWMHNCEADGCNRITKKGEKFCKKHK